ncbi:MAG: 50S ribosomal protein L18e [Candidatus Aenigmatarchaeota archaeon]|nr:MAG: 50S ribosomal protein L18e [Candidatus Aenigmarchaeota archaeon]
MKRTGSTNIHLRRLIHYLNKKARENNAPIWRRVAELLNKPTRNRVEVNISKLNRYTSDGDIVIVPGKVLGSGVLEHSLIVAAWSASSEATRKINQRGKLITIEELVEQYPKGSGVKIII